MRIPSRLRSPWFLGAASVAVVLLTVVLFWFEPQAALFDDEVNDSLPVAASLSEATSFVSIEHDTTGELVIAAAGGERFIRLEELSTTNGPDLHVYLSANPFDGDDGAFDDEFIDLGELRGNVGDQHYALDPSVDLSQYRSVVIWCDRFDAAFGAAPLPRGVSR
ncbi:MAG: DM13 domain-containing protein [Ilumatobacteraceae bacterium]